MPPAATYAPHDLLKIVSLRGSLLTVCLMAVLTCAIAPWFITVAPTRMLCYGLMWGTVGGTCYTLALTLRESKPWLALVTAFIPLVNLLMVFTWHTKASQALQESGIVLGKVSQMREQIQSRAS